MHHKRGGNNHGKQDQEVIDNGGHNVVYARDHDHHRNEDHGYPRVISGKLSRGD